MNARQAYLRHEVERSLTTLPFAWEAPTTAAHMARPQPYLVGWAVAFDVLNGKSGSNRTILRRGAFRSAATSKRDVPLWESHEARNWCGRTVLLDEDAVGLWVVGIAFNTEHGRTIVTRTGCGFSTEWSVSFRYQTQTRLSGGESRNAVVVEDAKLVEVSATDAGACPITARRLAPRFDVAESSALLTAANREARASRLDDERFAEDKANLRWWQLSGMTPHDAEEFAAGPPEFHNAA